MITRISYIFKKDSKGNGPDYYSTMVAHKVILWGFSLRQRFSMTFSSHLTHNFANAHTTANILCKTDTTTTKEE